MTSENSTNSSLVGVYGAGGFGREVLQMFRLSASNDSSGIPPQIVFVDSDPLALGHSGASVVDEDEFFSLPANNRFFTVAVAECATRRNLAMRMTERGADPISVISPNAIIDPTATIGQGAIIAPFVCINANAIVGSFFHANVYSYVGHDSVVGDFVTLSPRASVNGYVNLEDGVFVGTSAAISQGSAERPLRVGVGATVGLGSMVFRPVDDGETVSGNPAKTIHRPSLDPL